MKAQDRDLVREMSHSRRDGPPAWFKWLFFVALTAGVLFAAIAASRS